MSNIAKLHAGANVAAIVPTNIEELWRVAQLFAKSGLGPNELKGKPEAIATVLMLGLELGLKPMFALSNIYIVNGRPTVWGKAIPALLYQNGFALREWTVGEGDQLVAHCEITRPDGVKGSRSFSMQQARKAGLANKSGPWQHYPDRMCAMRARGFAWADFAADVSGGLYLAEEMEDAEPRDITPRDDRRVPAGDDMELLDPPTPDDVAEADEEGPQQLANPAEFVAHLRDELTLMPAAERADYVAEQSDLIASLPEEHRREVAAIIVELGEEIP